MRVLMISVRSDHGGGPRHMELLMRNLSEAHEVHVACPDDPPYGRRLRELAFERAITIPHRRFRLNSALALASYVRRSGVQVIHTHGKGAALYGRFAAALTGTPCVHTPHGVHVGSYGPLTLKLYRAYENLTSRWISRLLYVSTDECLSAKEHQLWMSVPHQVIQNGVDDLSEASRVVMRSCWRRSLGIKDDTFVVVTISRFDYQKNMSEAFGIAKALPAVTFVWIGDGEERAQLELMATLAGITNIIFVGAMDNPMAALAGADVYLSTSRWEGMPLAVLEAMASRLAVIASDVPGNRELVSASGGGLLYQLGNLDEAVRSLSLILSDGNRRNSMGERGRDAQRRAYSTKRQASSVAAVYVDVATLRGDA